METLERIVVQLGKLIDFETAESDELQKFINNLPAYYLSDIDFIQRMRNVSSLLVIFVYSLHI